MFEFCRNEIHLVASCAAHVLPDCVTDARSVYNCLSNDYIFNQRDLVTCTCTSLP